MEYSPIALFVYNRPEHTRKTLRALANNPGARNSDLYIFSDGPRSNRDLELVKEVRSIILKTNGYNKVEIVNSESNQGLAGSIIDGVTRLCKTHGKVIVMEDDLITSEYFLDYMNLALSKYEAVDEVMHISGYMFPIGLEESGPVFLPLTSSWGWGTWERAWRYFERDGMKLYRELGKRNLYTRFNLNDSFNYQKMLRNQVSGKNDSWAVRWYASVFLRDGLGLFPTKSLVKNIGLDGSGAHCSPTQDFDVELSTNSVEDFPSNTGVSAEVLERLAQYYRDNRQSLLHKVFTRLAQKIETRT